MNTLRTRIPRNGGLIKTVLLIVVVLLIISYYGLNLRELAGKETTKDNFGYVKTLTVTTWNTYLKKPATYLWNDIFLDLIWDPAINALRHIEDGDSPTPANAGPRI